MSLLGAHTVALRYDYDSAAVDAFVHSIAVRHDQVVTDGSLRITATAPHVAVEQPQRGVTVNQSATTERVVAVLTGALASPQPVVATLTQPRLSAVHVTHLAAALTTVFTAPRNVTIGTATVTLSATELAGLTTLVFEPSVDLGLIPRVVVDPTRLPERLLALASRQTRSPEPARFSSPQQPDRQLTTLGDVTVEPLLYPVFVIPAIDGLIVDTSELAQQMADAVTNGQSRMVLLLRAVALPEPKTPLADVLPTHLLATFTSPLIAGQQRNLNIELLAATLDDTVIMPGESFSINAISGPRSCTAGYVPAGAIIAGELVDVCGGGVSQVGTTVLNAAFFAGVQLDAFTPHSFYIGRYSPGREATLSYPRLDVAFTNTTAAALHLRTFFTPTSLTVSLYGKPSHDSVTARHGPRTDPRPFTEDRRLDRALSPGSEQVLQSGGDGFTITVTRIVQGPNGREQSEQFTTRYLPQRRIVSYNPAPPVPAPDEPEMPPSPNADTEAAPVEPVVYG